jgi:Initiator Replication protein
MATPPRTLQVALFSDTEPPKTFKKAVEMIHSRPREPITLVQRKLMNALIKTAVNTKADKDGWWSIDLTEMAIEIGFDSKNREHLKNAASALMRMVFDWDFTNETGPNWVASILFPNMQMDSFSLKYQINPLLKDGVVSPQAYALINMNIQRKFRRASTLALYEHIFRFINVGSTGQIHWGTLRDTILGVGSKASAYNEYKYFYAKVLKPGLIEINTESDIVVEMEKFHRGREITDVLFRMKRKNTFSDDDPSITMHKELLGQVIEFGVAQHEARKLLKQYGAEKMAASLQYTKVRMNDKSLGQVAKPVVYFKSALAKGWAGEMQDVEVKARPPTLAKRAPLLDQFRSYQAKNAERYYLECTTEQQQKSVEDYNNQQEVTQLRIKSKPSKLAGVAFFSWLAKTTWGEPSQADLLKFADGLLSGDVS